MLDSDVVLVTGATGKVGRYLVDVLLANGTPVRAFVRDTASADLPDGVDLVEGDLREPEALRTALRGVAALFLLWPPDLDPATHGNAVIRIAREHSPRISYLSAGRVRDGQGRQVDPITQAHADMERMIRDSGLEWTVLRPTGFASNTLRWATEIRTGDTVRGPYGDVTRSLVHERDIAAVAAHALTESGHAGRTYDLTGPERLTHVVQARIIGETLGRSVSYVELSPQEAREEMRTSLPDPVVETILNALGEMLQKPEPITSTVEEITGRRAHTFREWVVDHADHFR